MSCGVGCRRHSDPVLLCLWHRLAATAPTRPLAWESPYAMGVAQKMAKQQQQQQKKALIIFAYSFYFSFIVYQVVFYKF